MTRFIGLGQRAHCNVYAQGSCKRTQTNYYLYLSIWPIDSSRPIRRKYCSMAEGLFGESSACCTEVGLLHHYPDINVKVMISPKLEDLVHSEIDIAIRQGDPPAAPVSQEVLFIDPVVPICSAQLIDNLELNSARHLNRCRLTEVEDPTRFGWQAWFQHANTSYRPKNTDLLEVSSWEMGLNSVMDGNGVCLVPSLIAADLIERQLLVQPFDISIDPGIAFSFLCDTQSPRISRINVFRKWLKQELKKTLDR